MSKNDKVTKLNIHNTVVLFLCVITVLTTSCKQKSLVAGFKIGMEEKEWMDSFKSILSRNQSKNSIGNKLEDSLHVNYNFKFDDTIVECNFSINNDGVYKGKSRVMIWSFDNSDNQVHPNPNSDNPNYPTAKEDSLLYNELYAENCFPRRNSNGRIASILFDCTSTRVYSRLFKLTTNLYGKPDSIIDQNDNRIDTIDFRDTAVVARWNKLRNDWEGILWDNMTNSNGKPANFISQKKGRVIDTSFLSYYFHDNNSVIVLQRSSFYNSNYFIPFEHVTQCRLYQYSKTYENEIKTQTDLILKDLKPSELITIKLYNHKENKLSSFGLTPILTMTSYLGTNNRNTLAESREIESMKGRIEITDEFGSILQTYDNIVIDANGGLTCPQPGLKYALGDFIHEYVNYEYVVSAYLESKSATNAFKQAYKNKDVLNTAFIPEAIKFKDGTVLK